VSENRSREEIIVSEQLAELRGKVRLLTWVLGLSWTVLILFGGLLVTGLLDWMLHFDDSGVRLVIGLSLLTAASIIVWRHLILPLMQPLSPTFLAARIERRFPGLRSRVLSAVEFLQHRLDPKLGSSELQQAVVASALRDLETIQTHDVIETRAVRRMTIAGAVLSVVVATIVLLHPAEAATSVARILFPFSNCPWPRQNQLKLVHPNLEPVSQSPDQPIMIARGDTLELYVVDGHGRLPERVWFEHQWEGEDALQREPLRQTTLRDDAGRSSPAAVISWVASRGPLRFRAVGGDDDTMGFFRVHVVEPPTLETMQVTVTPPPYSGRPVETLPPGVGHVQGLLGTELQVSLKASTKLKAAQLHIADKPVVPLEIAADRQTASATFRITEPGVTGYWFELTDDAGFSDPESPRFELRGVADSVPDVTIEDPVADVQLTANAELPVRVLAKDDLGLTTVRIVFTQNELADVHTIPLPLVTNEAEPVLVSNLEHLWKLTDLKLQPGDRIEFRAEALDRYDLGPEPHIGKSTPRTITIITTDEKQKELAGRVGDLLENLQQATTLQERALEQTRELQTQLETAGELRTQDIDQLHRIELDQRQTASRLTRPADGVRSQARQLQDEFRANRLDDPETLERLGRIIDDLGTLERDQFPEIESALTRASKTAEDLQSSPATDPPGNSVPPEQSSDARPETGFDPKPGTTPDAPVNAAPTGKPGESRPERPEDPAAPGPGTPTSPAPQDGATPQDGPKPDRSAPRNLKSSLSQAQVQQAQALKSLTELQDVLSEWRDQRDVGRELESLIAEQEALQKDTTELGQRTLSKTGADLTPQEKADLAKVGARQSKVADRVDQFRKQLQQVSDALQDRDPDAAERFQEARDELGTGGTASKLREASQGIAENQIGTAAQLQQQALEEMQNLDRQLKREPTDDLEMLVKQIETAAEEFETLRKQQLELRDAARDLASQPESPQRTEQLEALQKRQSELADRLKQAERRLERLRLRRPTEAAERAQERLDRVQEQLEEPEQIADAAEEMQQVVDDLEQVEQDLEQERRFAEEQLAIEELEKIESQLRNVLVQQNAVIEETVRLNMERLARGSLSRGQLKTVRDLADVERGLQGELEALEKSLRVAEVFSLVLRRAARTLQLTAERLGDKRVDESVIALERDAVRKIESLLTVLTEQDAPQPGGDQPPPQPEGEQEPPKPQQAQPPGESLPQLAQLKLLKALQEEFLERTQLLDGLRNADGSLPEDAVLELEELAREQQELADLTRNLVAKMLQNQPDPDEPEGQPGDVKPNSEPDSKPMPKPTESELPSRVPVDDLLEKKPASLPLPKKELPEGELP